MRDAIGQVFSIQVILIFVLLVNGYMAYSVNYTKAFRVKNKIIDIIEESEGFSDGNGARDKIETYIAGAGYGVSDAQKTSLVSRENCFASGYCITCNPNQGANLTDDDYRGVVYHVVTYVSMDIPVINKIFENVTDDSFLSIHGDTMTIYGATCPKL